MKHQGLDHFAIVVPDTEAALIFWRDTMGFPLVHSEIINQGTIRLTHLDLGNTHLQLVEPLIEEHPLQDWLRQNGPGLHHFCLRVENVDEAMQESPIPTAAAPHQGIQGKRALFLNRSDSQNIQIEVTGA